MASVKKVRPDDVRYLAFEGGGGKGLTFLGAIQYLQTKDILPLGPKTKSKIKGIAGASAGGITALMLAIGYNADDLEKLLTGSDFSFNSFFEMPDLGAFRHVGVDNKVHLERHSDSFVRRLIGMKQRPVASSEALPIPNKGPVFPLAIALLRAPGDYVECVYRDTGLFSGFAVQRFLSGVLDKWGRDVGLEKPGRDVTFSELKDLTHVDLRLTGTNIITGRGEYFSAARCPDFPVAAAVGITMSLPIVFKPMMVSAFGGRGLAESWLRGYWIDGGVANNLPIHAFDDGIEKKRKRNPSTVNPAMVAFRLAEGAPLLDVVATLLDKLEHSRDFQVIPPSRLPFMTFPGLLLETLLYPASDGQLRSQEDLAHTVTLYSGRLSTLQFEPPREALSEATLAAFETTKEYFKD